MKKHVRLYFLVMAAILACMVLVGWFVESVALVQVRPGLAPMQFNTTLTMLLMLAAYAVPGKYGKALAALPLVVAGLMTYEYVSDASLGFGTLFMEPFTTDHRLVAGMPSLASVACFVLLGIARMMQDHLHVTARALHTAVIALALTALVGSLANVPTTEGWGAVTEMGLYTASCFLLIAIHGLSFASREEVMRWAMLGGALIMIGVIVLTLLALKDQVPGYENMLWILGGVGLIELGAAFGFGRKWAEADALARAQGETNTQLLGVQHDLQKSVADLRRSEQQVQAIFTSMYSFLCVVSPEGTIEKMNDAALKALGKRAEEMIGSPFAASSFWPDQMTVGIDEAFRKAAAGEVLHEQVEVVGRSGRLHLDFTFKAIFDEQQHVAMYIAQGHDITDRVLTQRAYEQTQERNIGLLNAIPDSIVQVARNGTYLSVKPGSDFDWFMHPEEIVGKSAYDLLAPDLADSLMETTQKALETRALQTIQYTVDVDGELRYREARVLPCGDDEVISIMRDFTDYYRSLNALQRSEAHNLAMLRALPDAVMRLTDTGICLDIRLPQNFQTGSGKMVEEGQSAYQFFPPQVVAHVQRKVALALSTEKLQSFTYETRDGSRVLFHEVRLTPCGSNEVLMLIRDVTKRKQAEDEAKRLKAFYESVLDDLPEELAVIEPNGHILHVNPAMVPDPRKRATLAGKNWMDFCRSTGLGPAYGFRWMKHFGQAITTRQNIQVEEETRTPQGDPRHLLRIVSPVFNDEGAVSHLIVYGLDITGRKKAELAMKKSSRALKESREELRELAQYLQTVREEERTRISREVHDVVGQALTAIRMEMTWVENELDEKREKVLPHLDHIKELIQNTIQEARRIATELRPGVLDDIGLAAALEWQVQEFARRTGIRYTFDNTADGVVLADEQATAMFRIFQEGLTNVARHAHASRIEVTLGVEGDEQVLTLRDNGRGIDMEHLRSTRSLGLIGMRERAQACNGRLELWGAPGQGTRLVLRIPLGGKAKHVVERRILEEA